MTEVSNSESDGRLPHHFVTFVEILFAVVLGASILEFHTLLFPPALASLSFWALIAVYFAAVTSWTGWHKSTMKYPYTDCGAGLLRSVLDAVIVGTYAALLFFGSRADNSLLWYLWGFVIVFFLYFIVGEMRRAEHHDPEASQIYLIIRHGAVVLIAAIAYTIMSEGLSQLPAVALWVFVLLPFVNMGSFRWFRDWRRLPWIERTKSKITIAIDMDGVLVEQVVPVLQRLKQKMDLDLNKCDITDWEYAFKGTNIKIEIERAEREEEFVRQMPPMEGAREALRILSEKFEIVIATSRETSTDPWSRDWLDGHGMPYKRLVNTCSQGKTLLGVDFLIDDYIGNIEEFIRNGPSGRQAILFAQPWNHDIGAISDLIASGKVRIAHTWQTILAILGCGFSKAEPCIGSAQTTRSKSQNELPRYYLALQALACFLASFLFLRGYILSNEGVSPIIPIPSWLHIFLSAGFLVLAFFFAVVAFSKQLQAIGNRILQVSWFPIGITLVAGLIVGWLDGMEGLKAGSFLHQVFFYAGLAFLLIFSVHFICSCWQYRQTWKTKG